MFANLVPVVSCGHWVDGDRVEPGSALVLLLLLLLLCKHRFTAIRHTGAINSCNHCRFILNHCGDLIAY